jgi:hypothetical protein
MEKEIEEFIKEHKSQDEYYEGDQFGWYMYDDNVMALIEVVKNLNKPDVSGRSELLFAFITEVKKEFADQNWDYLDFIAERVLKANNSH